MSGNRADTAKIDKQHNHSQPNPRYWHPTGHGLHLADAFAAILALDAHGKRYTSPGIPSEEPGTTPACRSVTGTSSPHML